MALAKILIGALACTPLAAFGQDAEISTASRPAATTSAETISRTITLADLGFGNGLSFRQLSGQTTVFIPVPDTAPLRGGTITLDITHGATVAVDRYLQVSVGGRPVATHSLGNRAETFSLPVDFDAAAVSGGFLAVGLTYSGAFTDRVCVDERASGDFLDISPRSAVTLDLDRDGILSPALFAGFRPADMRVTLPDQASLGGLAAATRAAALFGAETGGVRFGTAPGNNGQDWTEGHVQLEVATSGVQAEMQVTPDADFPALRVRGTDPQLGLWQLASGWAGLAGGETAITTAISDAGPDDGLLPLSALAADLTPRNVVSTEDVLIPFQSSDLPAGKTVDAVNLVVAAALDAEGRGATASVYLNDTLLGNRPLPSGAPERLNFDVPSGLIGRDNQLRVSIQRQPSGGECRFKPQGYPAQVLPGSALRLADADVHDGHFFGLRQEFGAGVQVVLDPALGLDLETALPWIAGVAGSMIPDRASILPRASVAAIEPGLPFFVISATNPGDAEPAITFDAGAVEIRNTDAEVIFAGDALDRLGVAQIVTRGEQPGLWLRPGNGPAPEPTARNPLVLNRGDLALLGQEGVIVATSTRINPVLDVVYPDRTSLAQIFAKYRPWIVGGAWVLLTLIVLIVFQRIYRNRRSGPGG
ncbi:cellulose biosynthesis cyclic di-GMP-binding regulatory protein BcsB [Pseudooceanicola aestuarii]|uniref:cellulose biosynthesis cyclic di-GMP-binding regulatory protein BcsB n=1 Tax=Pseudooceanicola aestuarii TaxID=2697319 RepID=UPI0013D26C47|nr:cellulose biosynthesis cyclic di-GMP-binding regulatory protein BcsB [Pseudooceanicola aestuarii]